MSNRTLNLTDSLYNYMLENSLREPVILKELRQVTAHMTGNQMQISPEQGQFMALLIELINAEKTLEIGVYTGYSTLAVALALPAHGKIVACDINRESTNIAYNFWEKAGVVDKIELRIAPALQTLEQLIAVNEQASFDFIFIDADKKNYPAYYEKALILLRPGGLLMLDNTLWGGAVADNNNQDLITQSMRELNAKLLHDQRITISLLPLSDGVTLARKRH